jgi:hypothetical protein
MVGNLVECAAVIGIDLKEHAEEISQSGDLFT